MSRTGSLAAAISIALVLVITACGGAALADGSMVRLTPSSPKVLTAPQNDDPVDDPMGIEWTGILRHAPECDCIVLEESAGAGSVSLIAWPSGTTGFAGDGSVGVLLLDGRRLAVGRAVSGRGTRLAFAGNPPVAVPAARDDCLLVATVN